MRIGVDLLWVRPGKNGGTESYIRNLMDGFGLYVSGHTFVLFASADNADTFRKYSGSQFELIICPVNTASFIKRVIWENFNLRRLSRKRNIDIWFFPVYSRPFAMGRVPTVTVIHDLQAIHYPEYFSKVRNMYFRFAWRADCHMSTRVVTISEFCKKDIVNSFSVDPQRVDVVYNPVSCKGSSEDFDRIAEKYAIERHCYFYTVCSLARHKNLITLIKAMQLLKESGSCDKLVISGVKENAEGEIFDFIHANGLEDTIIYTGFVSNEERNALYDNCRKFVFPSVFEGFGMPPIEAMIRGIPTLTTRETSIYEITEGKADYVDDPFDESEWMSKMNADKILDAKCLSEGFKEKYSAQRAVKRYMEILKNAGNFVGQSPEIRL